MLSLSWNVNLGTALYKWCTVANETFKYVVPRLAYHHEDAARVMTFQPRDNIFVCSTSKRASAVLSYDQLRASTKSRWIIIYLRLCFTEKPKSNPRRNHLRKCRWRSVDEFRGGKVQILSVSRSFCRLSYNTRTTNNRSGTTTVGRGYQGSIGPQVGLQTLWTTHVRMWKVNERSWAACIMLP